MLKKLPTPGRQLRALARRVYEKAQKFLLSKLVGVQLKEVAEIKEVQKLIRETKVLIVLLFVSLTIYQSSATDLTKGHSSVDFERIYFSNGMPQKSKKFNSDPDKAFDANQKKIAYELLDALKKYPNIKVEVVGYADKLECSPDDCRDLSFRRAQMVYTWLLKHGVLNCRLRGPTGKSTDWPLYPSSEEDERRFNRRVQLEPF